MRSLPLMVLVAGCATTATGPAEFKWRPDVTPADYFPLVESSTWSYEVVEQLSGEKLLIVNRVAARAGNRVTLLAGGEPLTIEERPGAMVRFPSETAVLRAPLAAGASWDIPGGTMRVTSVDARVDTPRGTFGACLVTEEITDERKVVTSYAPKVGPVRIEIWDRAGGRDRLDRVGLLRSYNEGGAQLR